MPMEDGPSDSSARTCSVGRVHAHGASPRRPTRCLHRRARRGRSAIAGSRATGRPSSSWPIARRFELDPAAGVVRFACRTADGTALVFEMLERLEALVARVNRAGRDLALARRPAAVRAPRRFARDEPEAPAGGVLLERREECRAAPRIRPPAIRISPEREPRLELGRDETPLPRPARGSPRGLRRAPARSPAAARTRAEASSYVAPHARRSVPPRRGRAPRSGSPRPPRAGPCSSRARADEREARRLVVRQLLPRERLGGRCPRRRASASAGLPSASAPARGRSGSCSAAPFSPSSSRTFASLARMGGAPRRARLARARRTPGPRARSSTRDGPRRRGRSASAPRACVRARREVARLDERAGQADEGVDRLALLVRVAEDLERLLEVRARAARRRPVPPPSRRRCSGRSRGRPGRRSHGRAAAPARRSAFAPRIVALDDERRSDVVERLRRAGPVADLAVDRERLAPRAGRAVAKSPWSPTTLAMLSSAPAWPRRFPISRRSRAPPRRTSSGAGRGPRGRRGNCQCRWWPTPRPPGRPPLRRCSRASRSDRHRRLRVAEVAAGTRLEQQRARDEQARALLLGRASAARAAAFRARGKSETARAVSASARSMRGSSAGRPSRSAAIVARASVRLVRPRVCARASAGRSRGRRGRT